MNDERSIFEHPPIVLSSKVKGLSRQATKSSRLFFVLNSNVYSVRSFIDYNTQQTSFISLRYLTFSPPFTFQNLLPIPMTLFFQRKPKEADRNIYSLDMKLNSQLQMLFLDPRDNFLLALGLQGYLTSSFVKFKKK